MKQVLGVVRILNIGAFARFKSTSCSISVGCGLTGRVAWDCCSCFSIPNTSVFITSSTPGLELVRKLAG